MTTDSRPAVELPDFDTLARLAQENPREFEALRRRLLRQAVDNAPAQHRPALEQTLVQLEQARSRARTPLEAATLANEAMVSSFQTLCGRWNEALFSLRDLANEAQNLAAQADPTGVSKTFIK